MRDDQHERLGVDLLLELPGIRADAAAAKALRLLDAAMADGDTCIDLAELTRRDTAKQPMPTLASWRTSLLDSGLVGAAASDHALILDGDLLSSRRYWFYERRLADACCKRAADRSRLHHLMRDEAIINDIKELFPAQRQARVAGVDWQRLAACVALMHGLAVITGGPGTGKTTVAGRVIAIAERLARRHEAQLDVIIAAPTGKAAQRLRESLMATTRKLIKSGFLSEEQVERLTGQVATLHRLLHAPQLAVADLVVIDEVSMADAATLSRVMDRIPDSAQVLLLGDPEQLASVDAGHVLGEIARLNDTAVDPALATWYRQMIAPREEVGGRDALHPLAAVQVHLRKNWRSAASPAVTAVANAIQDGPLQVQCALIEPAYQEAAGQIATVDKQSHAVWIDRRDCQQAGSVSKALWELSREWIQAVITADNPMTALGEHAKRRLLCARRSGQLGAEGLNAYLEQQLQDTGLIRVWDDGHYHGRPLLVTQNDYDLRLFNGDIGIVHGNRGEAKAYFPDTDDQLRGIPLHRLHAVEPVFAMSIHKSQGSQFDHVDIITALDDSGGVGRLLTRELLYTAVTRAAYSARLWANEDLLVRALERRNIRRTGMGRFLQDYKAADTL